METLAYLHSALIYETSLTPEAFSIARERSPSSLKKHSWQGWVYCGIAVIAGFVQMEGALALRRGDRGTAVTELQTVLKSQGYFSGPVTGVYGPMTEAAVRQFQTNRQLKVDGVAGTQTLGALQGNSVEQPGTVPLGTLSASSMLERNPIALGTPLQTTLRSGSRGDGVANLQRQLLQLNHYDGPVTGIFGPRTEAAVKRFQESQGLVMDGIVGRKTLLALQTLGASPSQPPAGSPEGQGITVTSPNNGLGTKGQQPSTPNAQTSLTTSGTPEVLQPGDSGSAVTALQTALQQVGDYQGPIDGFYSMQMAEAVREFQSRHSIPPDGIAGPRTQKAILDRSPVQTATVSSPRSDAIGSEGTDPQLAVSGQVTAQAGTPPTQPIKTRSLDLLTLQQRLQTIGLYPGPLDGKLGPKTRRAIRDAQARYGISEEQVWIGRF